MTIKAKPIYLANHGKKVIEEKVSIKPAIKSMLPSIRKRTLTMENISGCENFKYFYSVSVYIHHNLEVMFMVFEVWDPFEEIERLQRRINWLMRRMMEPLRVPVKELRETWMYESFPIDLKDTGKELILEADLPGFEKDEIKINLTEDSIEITASKKKEEKEVTETMYRKERIKGMMRRFITLPVKVDPESAEAEFKNGVLTIRMKKKEIKKGKEIKIK